MFLRATLGENYKTDLQCSKTLKIIIDDKTFVSKSDHLA